MNLSFVRVSALVVPLLLGATACASVQRGNGKKVTVTREAKDFTGLEVSGGFDVEVTQGDFRVEVEGDDNLLPFVKTRVRPGVLEIERESGVTFRDSMPLVVRIRMPKLEDVEVSGGVTLTSTRPGSDALRVDASGGSRLKFSEVQLKKLEVAASGGVKVGLEGTAEQAAFELSGGVAVQGEKLVAQNATIAASGGVRAAVGVQQALTADLSGGCALTVVGRPQLKTLNTSGGASISFKDP